MSDIPEHHDRITPTLVSHLLEQIEGFGAAIHQVTEAIAENNRKQAISLDEIRTDQRALRVEMREHISTAVNGAVDKEYGKTRLLLENFQLKQDSINKDHSGRLMMVESRCDEHDTAITALQDKPDKTAGEKLANLKNVLWLVLSGAGGIGLFELVRFLFKF
jgi:hypothetical protein